MAGEGPAEPRNLVICLDGTGNAPKAKGNTNVLRLYGMLDKSDPDRQIAFYAPGVGTRGDPGALSGPARGATKVRGLVTGYGMRRDIADAYTFAVDNYRTGDRIFIFGFSRGAFAALALAGVFRLYGLTRGTARNMVGQIVSEVSRPTKIKHSTGPFKFRQRFSIFRADGTDRSTEGWALPVHFLGLWDTVKALKYFRFWTRVREKMASRYYRSWPFTDAPELVTTIRHAVSLDDRRFPYDVHGFVPQGDTDFAEVWFAGVHSDIGGSFDGEDERDLGRISLKWMVEAAIACGLIITTAEYINKCTRKVAGTGYGEREAFSGVGPINRNSIVWFPLGIRRRIARRAWRRRFKRPVTRWFTTLPVEEIRVHQSVLDRADYSFPKTVRCIPVDPEWRTPRPDGCLTNAS